MGDELVYVEAMLARTMGNKSLAIILFKKLFLELPQQIAEIEKSIEQKQMLVTQKQLHKLHGSLDFCGFYELEALVGKLEKQLVTVDLELVVADLSLLAQKIKLFYCLEDLILKLLNK